MEYYFRNILNKYQAFIQGFKSGNYGICGSSESSSETMIEYK